MKLNHVESVQDVSMEEILSAEVAYLEEELKLKDLFHSVELIDTILACVNEEGHVSSSIEKMFGENFTSKETAITDLQNIRTSMEGIIKDVLHDTVGSLFNASKRTADTLRSLHKKVVEIARVPGNNSNKLGFPMTISIPAIANDDVNDKQYDIFVDAFNDPSDENVKKLFAACREKTEAKCQMLGNFGSYIDGIRNGFDRIDGYHEKLESEKDPATKNKKTMVLRIYERALSAAARAFIVVCNKIIADNK